MEMAFIKVLNMSISASWLVLVVIGLRFLLKKSPRWIHVCLWALVAVRLLCPISIESVFSLIPSTQTVPEEIFYMEPPVDQQNTTLEIVEPRPNAGSVDVELDTSVSAAQTRHIQWAFLWPACIAAMLIYALASYIRLKRKVSASIHLDNGVYLCDYIDTPFILGIIRPRIYLPSAMEPDSASHVLAHERAHITRRDHWWKPLGYLLLTVHWFNPLIWLAYILLCRDIELACDEKVVKQMALPERKSYSDALLKCSVRRMHVAACPLAFGEVGVKERVKTVLNYKKPAFWLVLVAIVALVATAVCFLTDPKTEAPDISEATGDSPHSWTSILDAEDIRKCWSYQNRSGSLNATIEGSRLEALVQLLNGISPVEFVSRKISGQGDVIWSLEGPMVQILCVDGTDIQLRFVGDAVIITPETDSGLWETDGYWVIENEAVKTWMGNLANGGTYMLSEANREEIRSLVRDDHVNFFDPQAYDDLLFVGCYYDGMRGMGVACYEPLDDGYKLRKLIRGDEIRQCASGSDLYYCDYNQYRIFLILNESVTGMEWAGAYENTLAFDTHPGLAVAFYPKELDAMYRFRYGKSATMYMDWHNKTHGNPPAYAADTFADPDDAYGICSNLRLNEVGLIWAAELVELNESSQQAFVCELTKAQTVQLLNLLHSLPESAFEKKAYPAEESHWVDVFIPQVPTAPYFQFMLHGDAVYFRFWSELENAHQPWKIQSAELKLFLDGLFTGDISDWDRFAPVVKIDGEIRWSVEEIEITIPRVTGFEYDISDEGVRFRQAGQEGWVVVQYCTEPFAVCGTGLQLMPGATNYGTYQVNTGYYDGNEVWSFKDIKSTSGDVVYNVVFLNEENARWVTDCENEIWEIIRGLAFSHPAFQRRSIPNRILEEPYELNRLYWSQLSEAEYAAELGYEEDGKSGSVKVSYDGNAYTVTDEAGSRNYQHCVKSQAETTPGTLMEVFFLTDDPEMTIEKYQTEADILPTEVIHVDIRTFDAAKSYGEVPESLKGLMEMGDEWSPRFYCQDSVFYLQYAAAMSSARMAYGLTRVDYHGNQLCEITVKGIPQEILELEDGGFAVYTQSYEDSLYELSCYDEAGEFRWRYSFEEAGSCYVAAMVQKNEDIYCFGEVTPKDSSSDIFIWRLNPEGELVKKRQLGGSDFDSVYRVLETKKGFTLYGSTQSGDGDLPLSKTGYGVGFRVEVTDDLEPGRAVKADVLYSGTAGYHEGETVDYDDPILKMSADDLLPEFLNCSASIFDWEDGYVLVRTLNYEAYPYGHPMVSMLTYYHQQVMTGYDAKGNPVWQLAGNVRSG